MDVLLGRTLGLMSAAACSQQDVGEKHPEGHCGVTLGIKKKHREGHREVTVAVKENKRKWEMGKSIPRG